MKFSWSEFLVGEEAVLTVVLPSEVAEKHKVPSYCYEFKRALLSSGNDDVTYHFVRVMTDDFKWVYVGKLDTYTLQVVPTRASHWPQSSYRLRLLNRLLPRLWYDDLQAVERAGFRVFQGVLDPEQLYWTGLEEEWSLREEVMS